MALSVAGAGIAIALIAFQGGGDLGSPVPVGSHENGLLAYRTGGSLDRPIVIARANGTPIRTIPAPASGLRAEPASGLIAFVREGSRLWFRPSSARDWAAVLTMAGFRGTQPTAWLVEGLVEGLLIYLSVEKAARLLTTVGELSAANSQLSFEYGSIAESPLLAQAHSIRAM